LNLSWLFPDLKAGVLGLRGPTGPGAGGANLAPTPRENPRRSAEKLWCFV